MKYTLLAPIISLIGGGSAAAVAKKMKAAVPKRHFMVVPYGNMAYKTMFNNPVTYRFGKRKGNIVERSPKQFRRIPLLERLACIDARPQRHELPPQEVTFRDGVSFTLLPILSYQVVYGEMALFEVEEWHRYLVEGCQLTITCEAAKLSYREFLNSTDFIEKLTFEAQNRAETCGILVSQLSFKDRRPSARGEVIVSQEALGAASALALNAMVDGMSQDARTLDPMYPAALMGGSVLMGGASSAVAHGQSSLTSVGGAKVLDFPSPDQSHADG